MVFIIWGLVIYKVMDYFNFSDADETKNVLVDDPVNQVLSSNIRKNNIDTLNYIELDRNPFIFAARQKITVTKQKNKPPKKQIPPVKKQKINYAINGVIINEKHKLVIFEDLTNNKTLFLKEGEVYNEITIKEIGKKNVSIVEAEIIKEFSLH